MQGSIGFHEWLKNELRTRKWSQRKLALLAGIDPVNISNYVHDVHWRRVTPREETCDRLASALGLNRNYLRAMAGRAQVPDEPLVAPPTVAPDMKTHVAEFEAALHRLRTPEQRRVATQIALDVCTRLGELQVS